MSEPVKIAIVQGGHAETLWAEPLPEGLYRIDNIPLEIYNVSLGDVVTGSMRNDLLYGDALFDKSGNQTVRVQIADGLSSPAGASLLQLLDARGARYETYGNTVLSANIPPGVDFEDLRLQLTMLKRQGVKFEQLDRSPQFAMPAVPGSPAQAYLDRAAQDERKWFDEWLKSGG